MQFVWQNVVIQWEYVDFGTPRIVQNKRMAVFGAEDLDVKYAALHLDRIGVFLPIREPLRVPAAARFQ